MEKNTENNTNTELDAISVQRNYKDTVFRMIFKDKKELLALYNAINNTSHKNIDDLDYVSKTFSAFYQNKDLYASTQKIKLPNPRFIVFYNGTKKQEARVEIKLSDLYMFPEESPKLELIVTQININPGYNDDLMIKCPTLKDYMLFVDLTRKYEKSHPFKDAINLAIDECIRRGILADFLRKNRSEVVSMSIFEYNEKLHEQTLREEGEEIGIEKGEDRMAKLYTALQNENRLEDWSKALGDKLYKNKLFEEFNL